ncbi:MAG: dipicolinate synthase subunit B [Bacillota bacterium]
MKKLDGINIGFALTGSHCTIQEVLPEIRHLIEQGAKIFPIASVSIQETSTRFNQAEALLQELEEMTGNPVLTSIVEVEPIGPKGFFHVLVVSPCTGNTLAKMANGITDGPVLMAAKAHLRNQKPLVIGISTNDGLGANAKNWATLINTKNIYMIPFGQDDPINKVNSLKSKMELTLDTILAALAGKQLQPLLVSY